MAWLISYLPLELLANLDRLDGEQLLAKRCGVVMNNPTTSGTNRSFFTIAKCTFVPLSCSSWGVEPISVVGRVFYLMSSVEYLTFNKTRGNT